MVAPSNPSVKQRSALIFGQIVQVGDVTKMKGAHRQCDLRACMTPISNCGSRVAVRRVCGRCCRWYWRWSSSRTPTRLTGAPAPPREGRKVSQVVIGFGCAANWEGAWDSIEVQTANQHR